MSGLREKRWIPIVEGPDRALLEDLYVPALSEAVRYDRSCAYFSSTVLATAARGFGPFIQRLLSMGESAPKPAIRLLVNEELSADDVRALTDAFDTSGLERQLLERLRTPADALARQRLEMLAWLVSKGYMQIRVGVMRTGAGILHSKFGIVTDSLGDQLVFQGSGNETASGLAANFEILEVSGSWENPVRRDSFVRLFDDLWSDNHAHVHTVPLPEAVELQLIRLAPPEPPIELVQPAPSHHRAAMLWRYIVEAPYHHEYGPEVSDATALVEMWPHQHKVVSETAEAWPDGRLLCDEVGLGKTIEAILILRRLIAGRGVKRALILLPAGLLRQWQAELREKGGLVVPRYENARLIWPDGRQEQVVHLSEALEQDMLILSRELARLPGNRDLLLEACPWDLVILDEAHAARRKEQEEGEFNSATLLLELLRQLQLSQQARGIMLMSATPMQTHPWEPWDLLTVLGEGGRWLADFNTVRRYYAAIACLQAQDCDPEDAGHAARLIASDRDFPGLDGHISLHRDEQRIAGRLQFATSGEVPELARWMREGSPLARRMHRNTRETLREYWRRGLLDEPPAQRHVDDVTFDFRSDDERGVYDAITGYIDRRFRELENERGGKGFVMTVYRRRAASSMYALRRSLGRRADGLWSVIRNQAADRYLTGDEAEDILYLDDLGDDWEDGKVSTALPESPEVARRELEEVQQLLARAEALGERDSKRDRFYEALHSLRDDGRSVLVFTEYSDTMYYLRDSLQPHYQDTLACYSGDGGLLWEGDAWTSVSKSAITDALNAGRIQVLLCTDAASEGLNLQSASSLINYDLPWNPSKVEQRIGRIDRIGQKRSDIVVVNLFLKDSIDDSVYSALRSRCQLFEEYVGEMQPVLAEARRMLSGQQPLNIAALEAIAERIEHDPVARETYVVDQPHDFVSVNAPLKTSDLLDGLNELSDISTIQVSSNPQDQTVTVSRSGYRTVTFASSGRALDSFPSAAPLTPLGKAVRSLSEVVQTVGEHLPLVVGAYEADAFRAVDIQWVSGNTWEPVTSYDHLCELLDAWDGTPADPHVRLLAENDARATARSSVETMVATAKDRTVTGLQRQVEAARLRLLRELARYLLVMDASPRNLNARWHELISTRDRSVSHRLTACYNRIGEWPDWDPDLVSEALDFVNDMTDYKRRTWVTGSAIDAALADPRWQVKQLYQVEPASSGVTASG